MDTIIEALKEEQIRLITQYKDMDISQYHRQMDRLTEAITILTLYKRDGR